MQSQPKRGNSATVKRGNPAMVRGGPSLNPSGRPKGFRGVSAQIMEATNNGADMVDWAISVWQDNEGTWSTALRWEAFKWLSERALGKPVQPVDLRAEVEVRNSLDVDISRISKSKRDAIRALHRETLDKAKYILDGVVEDEDETVIEATVDEE